MTLTVVGSGHLEGAVLGRGWSVTSVCQLGRVVMGKWLGWSQETVQYELCEVGFLVSEE